MISDRERIARDLHDVVIQRLFATGLQLQGIALRAADSGLASRSTRRSTPSTSRSRTSAARSSSSRTGRAARCAAEIRKLAREYTPVAGLRPDVRTDGPVDTAVSRPVREQLLPVLREALSNVARHASAEHAEIEVWADAPRCG